MSDPADFTMTYPAYVIKDNTGRPELVEIDGATCVGMFTDRAVMQGFYNDKHREKSQPTFKCFVFKSVDVLLQFFEAFQPAFDSEGVGCVAVNVQPGEPPMYAPIRDFVEHLKRA